MTVPRFALALIAGTVLASCAKQEEAVATIQTAPVTRQDIVVDAAASGAIEPINVVEVKSKSSGQIVKMTVETGSLVQAGDLLVQLETATSRTSSTSPRPTCGPRPSCRCRKRRRSAPMTCSRSASPPRRNTRPR
jgi:multidrug efflux pump subunit AcrA (membrane-fusion protein)